MKFRKAVYIPLFLLAFCGAVWKGAGFVTNASASTVHPPVILVHGYNNKFGNCKGVDMANYWNKTPDVLTSYAGVPSDSIIPVSYYKCDIRGYDMTGYGPDTEYPLTMTTGLLHPRAGYNNDRSITDIAKDFAWFTYDTYTKNDQPVYAVGHSMGGLIIRAALQHVQAGDPAFPPALSVLRVLTISTPHKGTLYNCGPTYECSQMSPDSQFIADLQANPAPQGVNGTEWWAMGTSGTLFGKDCDIVTADSATAIEGAKIVYTSPCYSHMGYMADKSLLLNAEGSVDVTGGRHSLAMMGFIVQ